MADTAFDPNPPPQITQGPGGERLVWDGRDWVQSAVGADTAAPAAGPPPAPAPTSAPPQQNIQFFRQGQQEPIVVHQGDAQSDAQGVQTRLPPPPPRPAYTIDFDDQADYVLSQQNEWQAYDKNVLSHKTGRAQPLRVTEQEHPEWGNWQSILDDWNKLDKREQTSGRRYAMEKLYNRIQSDTKRAEAELREKRRQEAHGLDAPRLTQEARDKIGTLMSGYVDQEFNKTNDVATRHSDPEKKRQADFELKTSPLTTMKYKDRDGKENLNPLRDVVTSISQLNDGVSNDAIVRYTLGIGSPVGFDKEGRPLPGMNEVGGRYIRGKGATNYRPLGRDAADNIIIRMDDGQELRIPPQAMRLLGKAREQGYENAKRWMEDDKKAREHKGLGTRLLERIIPPKGF